MPNLQLLLSKKAQSSNWPQRVIHSAISSCTKNLRALSTILLSSHDPISLSLSPNSPSLMPIPRTHTSKPLYTSYDTQIHPQLLHCLQTFNNSSDYRHYRLFRCGFRQRRGRQKILHRLCLSCQWWRNNLVMSQTTHCRILQYGIGIHGTL